MRARLAIIGLACALAAAAPLAQQTTTPPTAIRFARVWDGSKTIPDAVVVCDAGKITSVGSGASAVPAGARVLDLRPLSGIPGLIDLHTHITYYWDRQPGTRPLAQPRRRPAVTVYLAQDNARRTLETGVTTVRDLGASNEIDFAMRDLIAMGAMPGPRLLIAGQGISAQRGATPNPDAMRQAAEERLKTTSDWIKVYASRGSFQSVDTTQTLTFDELKAIVDAAHAQNRKVAIHSYGASGVKDAVRAGADSVEHGIELDDETIAEMVKRGTVWVPTIDHNRYYVDAKDEYGFAPETIGPLQEYIQKNLESTRRAFKAGVKIGMGSDAVYSMFGQNTRELGWFIKAGMTPVQALATATTTAAELLGMGDKIGRLSPGFFADMVAVDGDPTEDIDVAIDRVRVVVKDGQVVVDKRGAPPARRIPADDARR
jgi:imidazolonepropionase-like amidohydrolase